MSTACRRRPRARGRPARRDRDHPSPGRPARPLDHPLLLPQGRHARLHRRGVRVPRQQRDDPRARRRRLGDQPAGCGQQARLPREVRAAVHAARRRGPRGRRRLRHVGREAELRQDLLGLGADHVPDRAGRPDRPGLAEGQAGGPRGRGPRRTRRAPGGARFVTLRAPTLGRAGTMTETADQPQPIRPRLATGPLHGHRRAPRRRRVRAGRDRRPLDRRRVRGLAGVLHQRRPGRRGPRRRPARPGGAARDRAAGRRVDHRLRRRHASSTSPTAPSPTTSPCASSSSARSGRSGRTPSWPPIPRRSSTRAAAINHTDHRAAGIAAVDAVYPAARNPMAFPWLAGAGWRPTGSAGSTSSGRTGADTWVDVSATLERKIDALARARQPDPRPGRPGRADPDLGGRGGRGDRGDRRRGAAAGGHRRRRGRGTRLTGRRQPSSSRSGRIRPQWFQTSASPSARRPSIATISASVRSPAIPARYSSAATLDVAEQLGGLLLGRPVADAHRVEAGVAERQRQVALRRLAAVGPAAEPVEPVAERRQRVGDVAVLAPA